MKYEDLSQLAMWEDWQRIVAASLPNFAASPIFVQQRSQTDEEFERAAEYVSGLPFQIDPLGKTRDEQYGAIVRDTKALGRVTRMWIDTNTEVNFLIKHLGHELAKHHVLDIGAGYGRLAVGLSPLVKQYTCIDAVPISTKICAEYTSRYAPKVLVPTLTEFLGEIRLHGISLAINVHSWNECNLEQIGNWLALLKQEEVMYLFTVSNGSLVAGRQAYSSWGGNGGSFRPILENQYDLIAEESIGLSLHPHALWRLK